MRQQQRVSSLKSLGKNGAMHLPHGRSTAASMPGSLTAQVHAPPALERPAANWLLGLRRAAGQSRLPLARLLLLAACCRWAAYCALPVCGMKWMRTSGYSWPRKLTPLAPHCAREGARGEGAQ